MTRHLAVTLAVLLAGDGSITLEQMRHAAEKAFPAPEARWEVEEQTFWPTYVVLRLVSSSMWPHHPAVAVAPGGQAVVLSRVQHVSDENYLARFNRISEHEHVRITGENAAAFASFFLRVWFDPRGHLCVVGAQSDCSAGQPGAFSLTRVGNAYQPSTRLQSVQPPGVTVLRLTVRANGTIAYGREWTPERR